MGNRITKQQAPHTWYPEILHWKEGDEIKARNANAKSWFSKIMAFEVGKLNIFYYYKGVTSDGFIIVEEKETGHLHKLLFKKFIRKATNLSYKNRTINSDIDTSKEYMALMDEFQKAYLELQEADNQKLLK